MARSKSKWQGTTLMYDNFEEIQNAESIPWNVLDVYGSNSALFRLF